MKVSTFSITTVDDYFISSTVGKAKEETFVRWSVRLNGEPPKSNNVTECVVVTRKFFGVLRIASVWSLVVGEDSAVLLSTSVVGFDEVETKEVFGLV